MMSVVTRVSSEQRAPAQSDLGLMKLVANGDARAQRVLAHRLAGRVQRVAHRLLSHRADADDAAQMALIEILRSAESFRDESSIERWADRITVRTALRYARDQRKRPWMLSSRVDAETVRSFDEDAVVHEDTPRRLEAYLGELPSARREVLVMKHGLGYTTEEIAELLGAPIGTIKDRLVAARKQIRKLIVRELRVGAGARAQKDEEP
jgi:RNA polymerase sigma-70 factor (ECF subfamily)